MTDAKLISLYASRKAALTAMATGRNGDRETGDAFRAADRAIVRELLLRGKPVRLPGMVLYLTSDQLNFVALKPGTTVPVSGVDIPAENVQKMLWHYRMKSYVFKTHKNRGSARVRLRGA